MKVLQLNFGKHYGGTEIVIKTILQNSKRIQNLVVLREDSKFHKELMPLGIENMEIVPLKMSPKFFFSSVGKIKKLCEENEIKAIHAHGVFAHLIGTILKYKYKDKIQLVTTIHSDTNFDRTYIKNIIFSAIENFCLRKTDTIIAVSNFIKKTLENKGLDPSKIVVIYNGVNFVGYNNDKLISTSGYTIGSFGRLEKIKGHEYLLRAVALIKNKISDFKCYIVGEGEEYENLKDLTEELNIKQLVTFHGFKSDIYPILREVDVVVLPSIMEALSLSAIEALLNGKPVVASNIGGIPEVVKHMENGILFKPRDVEDLADAIYKLYIDSRLRQELADSGLESTKKQFSSETMMQKIEYIYTKNI